MAHLAREWLQESPFVGIEITRFKILIVICKDPMTGVPTLKDFNKRDTDQFMGHDVIYKGMEYLEELDALPKREKAASQKNEPSVK